MCAHVNEDGLKVAQESFSLAPSAFWVLNFSLFKIAFCASYTFRTMSILQTCISLYHKNIK